MNILPLVVTFLIIFSCFAATFLKELKSFALIERALDGYHRTESALNNAIAQRAYKRIKRAQKVTSSTQKTSTSAKQIVSKREFFPPLEDSKFHLAPLLTYEGEIAGHPLYKPFTELLRLLYQNCLFKQEKNPEKLAELLTEGLLKKAKKSPDADLLAALCPDDPRLQKIYYKMLKGTNQYSRSTGIPPLEHFLSLADGEKAIHIGFASPLLLEALFGEKITAHILEFEKKKAAETEKPYYFSKQDLQPILTNAPGSTSVLTLLEPYLNDAKQFKKREVIGGRDRITKIAVEKTL